MTARKRTKVFCIGFQKTGTTSLNVALTSLGYRVASVWGFYFKPSRLKSTYVEGCIHHAQKYDAVEDMPWPLLFRELDAAYPGSKFILTWRDSDRWLKSICSHFGVVPHPLQQLTYGDAHPCPVGHEERYVQVYEAHNVAVREYFKDRPDDLLELNLEEDVGWEELCAFIGETPPDRPFPRANPSGVRKTLRYKLWKRQNRILGRISAALPSRF